MLTDVVAPPVPSDLTFPAPQFVEEPERQLWELLMDVALQRINIVLNFARNWSTLRRAKNYELERAKCVFHLEWIFNDDAENQFSFGELCRYSRVAALLDVARSRRQIRQAFCLDAAREMELPISSQMRTFVTRAWLGSPISPSAEDVAESR